MVTISRFEICCLLGIAADDISYNNGGKLCQRTAPSLPSKNEVHPNLNSEPCLKERMGKPDGHQVCNTVHGM
jgi:hypothetical protein